MIAGYGLFSLGHLSPELTLKPTLERVYPALEVGHCCRGCAGVSESALPAFFYTCFYSALLKFCRPLPPDVD